MMAGPRGASGVVRRPPRRRRPTPSCLERSVNQALAVRPRVRHSLSPTRDRVCLARHCYPSRALVTRPTGKLRSGVPRSSISRTVPSATGRRGALSTASRSLAGRLDVTCYCFEISRLLEGRVCRPRDSGVGRFRPSFDWRVRASCRNDTVTRSDGRRGARGRVVAWRTDRKGAGGC
jgi:hypothetical protein